MFDSLEILIFNQGPCRSAGVGRVSLLEAAGFEGVHWFVCSTSNGRSVHSMSTRKSIACISDLRYRLTSLLFR